MTLPLWDGLSLACCAEVLARKPGNVHPQANFEDLTARDFLRSAGAAAPELASAAEIGVGPAVENAIAATRRFVGTNTNLGICLLLAPCAAADASLPFRDAISRVLAALTVDDSRAVYRAIRLASPAGLGTVESQDVAHEPTQSLRDVMALAADRDSVAAQYANGFRDIAEVGVPALRDLSAAGIEQAIIGAHLRFMAACPDSLIARKGGDDMARQSASRAQAVLDAGWPAENSHEALQEFDTWLRADGHRRNPGTSADLVAASLFVAIRWGAIDAEPLRDWCDAVRATLPVPGV